MRSALLLFGLGILIGGSPPVELSETAAADSAITVRTLPAPPWTGPGPGAFGTAGAESLIFAVPPQPGAAPVMPDLPWELPEMEPDDVPVFLPGQVHALSATPLSARTANHRRVTANVLRIRSGPSRGSRAVASLRAGDIAEVTGRARNGWVPIRLPGSGAEGWAFHRFLAPARG